MRKIIYISTVLFFIFLQTQAQQTFKKTITGNFTEKANDLVATTDGGFVLVGETNITSGAKTDMFVTRVDINGDLVWGKTIGNNDYDYGDAIAATKDGGFAVAGSSLDAMSIAKLDAVGTVLWSKTYSAEKFNGAHAVIQTLDGGWRWAVILKLIVKARQDIL